MFKLNTQLENRLKHDFFGAKVSENIEYFKNEEKIEFVKMLKLFIIEQSIIQTKILI